MSIPQTLPMRPGGRLLKSAEAQAWSEGFAFLDAARAEAERLRDDQARQVAQARHEGFQAGERKGQRQAAQRLVDVAVGVETYLAGLEAALAELALDIARQVLAELDPDECLARLTRQALSQFRSEQALTLWVPVARAEALGRRFDDLPPGRLRVCGSEDLQGAAARLAGPAGHVDLELDAQLAWIRQALLPAAQDCP